MQVPMAKQRDATIASAMSDYGNRLFRFIRSRVPTNADAEDILQDVWYQFARVLNFESIEEVSGWLFRVARNRVTDSYRKRRPEALDDMLSDEDGEHAWQEILLADHKTPETETLRELFWEELFGALEELPQEQRNAFVWNELDDETFQEMADRTGVSIKTWISRKRYAVRFLRARLDTLYDEFFDS